MGTPLDSIKDPKLREQITRQLYKLPLPNVTTMKRLHKGQKRIRQSTKPLLNKLEREWFDILSNSYPNYPRPRGQAKRYRICNGMTFTPDITCSVWPVDNGPARETAWEVKGPYAYAGALDKLKMAARAWPEVRWVLVWKDHGVWRQQEVLP